MTGFTASFSSKAEMQKAYKYLRNCSILSECKPHRGDNRLNILIPVKSTREQIIAGLQKQGFKFDPMG